MTELASQYLRHAIRGLMRAPGFAVTATLTLALGIGLSTAVFTVADAVLLRRLPVGDQDRVVVLWGETPDGRFSNWPLPLANVREFGRRSRSLDSVAFFAFRGATAVPIRVGSQIYPIQVSLVSGNFFTVLRSRAALGRTLTLDDDLEGAAPVLVLSHRAWQQRFGGDSSIIGRTVTVVSSGLPRMVVGVMPQGLEYPGGTDAWTPLLAWGAEGGFLNRVTGELDIIARLRPTATMDQARGELTSFFGRTEAPAAERAIRGVAHSFEEITLGKTKPAVLLFSMAAVLLLFLTCVNVANLFLVRALGRIREVVVRAALGASRARIVAQSLTEAAIISVLGGLIGVLLAFVSVRLFVALAPPSLPRLDEIAVNRDALVAALLITSATMLLSGTGPAYFASRFEAQDALRSGSRHTGGIRIRKAAEMLVAAQIALAAVSLTGAALMARSLITLQQVPLSFRSEQLLVASLSTQMDRSSVRETAHQTLEVITTTIEALPGVSSVSPALSAPFVAAGGGIDGRLSTPGQSRESSKQNPMVNMEIAAPNYFAMLGVPILEGRAFSAADRDGSTPVIIVSRSVASHFWPNESPIGKRLTMQRRELVVAGVVPDTRYRELQTARPTVYFPLRQSPFSGLVPSTLLIRTTTTPAEIVPAIRRAVTRADAATSVVTVSSLESLLDVPRAQPRLNAMILVLFGAAAVTLAGVGLFAILSTVVRQRTHEMGVRMALGATVADVRRLILARGLALASIGGIIGMVGALMTSRLLSTLLFEISPADPLSLAAVIAVILGAAGLATLIPARSIQNISPMIALRGEV